MAKMYPTTLEGLHATHSERVMFDALRDSLSESVSVFYSVTWYRNVNGVRENSECDFLVFDPDFGFMTIEVKGGTSIQKNENEWRLYGSEDQENYRVLKRSPFAQAEQSMRAIHKYYEEQYQEGFPGIYGYACAFPNYRVDNDFGIEAPQDLIIDIEDLDTMQVRINQLFHYWKGQSNRFVFLSQTTRERFLRLINKRVSLNYSKLALIQRSESHLLQFGRTIQGYIDLLDGYPQACITGGAGTGKTWMCMEKAVQCLNEGKRVLLLCYNIGLMHYLQEMLNDYESVTVSTFGQFVSQCAAQNLVDKLGNELNGIFDLVSALPGIPKYAVVLIDEAQDYSEEWGMTARLFLESEAESTFYVFCDEQQNIFGRDFSKKFSIDNRSFYLRNNLRNTSEIAQFATRVTGLGADSRPSILAGSAPELSRYSHAREVRTRLTGIFNNLLDKERIPNTSIVLLSNRRLENSVIREHTHLGLAKMVTDYGQTEDGSVEILYRTVQGFKGLEANIVIYLDHHSKYPLGSNQMLQYVAYTRAKYLLYVIEYGEPN